MNASSCQTIKVKASICIQWTTSSLKFCSFSASRNTSMYLSEKAHHTEMIVNLRFTASIMLINIRLQPTLSMDNSNSHRHLKIKFIFPIKQVSFVINEKKSNGLIFRIMLILNFLFQNIKYFISNVPSSVFYRRVNLLLFYFSYISFKIIIN